MSTTTQSYILTEIPDTGPLPKGSSAQNHQPNDEEDAAASIGSINFCLRYQSVPFSFKLPSPVDNLSNLYQFHSAFRQHLRDAGKCRSNELQLNLWPLVCAGHSTTTIGPRQSGKTTAYVLALLNRLWLGGYIQPRITADKMMPKSSPVFQPQRIFGAKIYAIILADSMLSVMQIGKEFNKWLRVVCGAPPETEVSDKPGSFTEHDNDARQAYKKRNQYSIRILQLHNKSSRNDYLDVCNGAAVLIATAGALTKLVHMDMISLNDNKVFVIDRADEFINLGSEVASLFSLSIGSPKYDFLTNRQTMVFGQNWTEDIKRFFFEVQQKSILVLNSLVDSTVLFQQASANIELVPHESTICERVERIVLKLSESAIRQEALVGVVICKDYEQITNLVTHLEASKQIDHDLLKLFALKEQCTNLELSQISVQLLTHHPNRRLIKLVLLTSDDLFNFALHYRKFNCLIHLDRFEQQQDFKYTMNYRLLMIYDNLIGAFGDGANVSEALWQMEQLYRLANPDGKYANNKLRNNLIINYFVLVRSDYEDNEERFKQVVTDVLEYSNQLMVNRRVQPDGSTTSQLRYEDYLDSEMVCYIKTELESIICPQYAAFAKCKSMDKKIPCWKGRHTLYRESGPGAVACINRKRPAIERNTQIRFRISHVVDNSQFYIQLLSYRTANQLRGEWIDYNDHLEMKRVQQLLLRYKQVKHLNKFKVIKDLVVDRIFALFHYDDIHRVKLIKVIPCTGSEDLPVWLSASRAMNMEDDELRFFKLTVEVLAIDLGRIIRTRAYNLIELDLTDPDTALLLDDIPPLAYRMFLADVAPPHGEYSWDRSNKCASVSTDNVLLSIIGSEEDNYLTGWVLASADHTLWLHQVILSKKLHMLGVMQKVDMSESLIRKGVAVRNDRKFPDCDYDAHQQVSSYWRCNIQRKLAKFQWLDTSSNVHLVYFTQFNSLDHIFVVRQDMADRLNHLELQWANELKQKMRREHEANRKVVSVILHRGQMCFYMVKSRAQDTKVMVAKRAQIVSIDHAKQRAYIVLLDYGIEKPCVQLDSLWPIEDEQITCLPFQGIRLDVSDNDVHEFTPIGILAARTIAKNVKMLAAIVEFTSSDPEHIMPFRGNSVLVTIDSVCLDFARYYQGAIYLYEDDLQLCDWRLDQSVPLERSNEMLVNEYVPVHFVAFLMKHGFVYWNDNFCELINSKPAFATVEPISDEDTTSEDICDHENKAFNPKSQASAERMFQLLNLLQKPTDPTNPDDEEEEEEEKREVKVAPKVRIVSSPTKLETISEEDEDQIAEEEEEEEKIVNALCQMLQNEVNNMELVKGLLLEPDDEKCQYDADEDSEDAKQIQVTECPDVDDDDDDEEEKEENKKAIRHRNYNPLASVDLIQDMKDTYVDYNRMFYMK